MFAEPRDRRMRQKGRMLGVMTADVHLEIEHPTKGRKQNHGTAFDMIPLRNTNGNVATTKLLLGLYIPVYNC